MGTALAGEETFDGMHGDRPTDGSDRLGKRDILRADLDAVLCIAAITDAATAHQCFESCFRKNAARAMVIEEPGLADRMSANE